MMEKDRIMDDIARVAGGTVSILSGLNRNIRSDIRSRIEELALRLDLVPREDFDRLESVLLETRKRVEKLEEQQKEQQKPKSRKTKKSATAA